jgi:hypothetical protein
VYFCIGQKPIALASVVKNKNHLVGAGFKPARRIQLKAFAHEIGNHLAGIGRVSNPPLHSGESQGTSEKASIVNVLSAQYKIYVLCVFLVIL